MMAGSNQKSSVVDRVRVYRPDDRFSMGPISAVRALAGEVFSFRSHIRMIFANEFQSSYRGTLLGVIWNIILPLVPIGTYVLLANLRVLPRAEGLEPAVFIGFNITIWYLMIGAIQRPITIVKSRNAEAMKTAMPLSASIASSFAQLLFDALVRAVAVLILVASFQSWPALTAPLLPFVLFSALSFSIGLGLILAIFNAVYPDVERVIGIILQYGIFLSGVIFPLAGMPALIFMEYANPFSVFVHASRDTMFTGGLTYPMPYIAWSVAGGLLFIVGARFFYIMEQRLRVLV